MNSNTSYRRKRFPFFIIILPVVLLVTALIQWLWNTILPDLLHVGTLTYWKALGLLVLCRILFGGFRGPSRGRAGFGSNRWREKWSNMSDEEKAQFKERWQQRCGKRKA